MIEVMAGSPLTIRDAVFLACECGRRFTRIALWTLFLPRMWALSRRASRTARAGRREDAGPSMQAEERRTIWRQW